MAPVKFDDIPKVATEVLNDDYQVSGFQLKAKQQTNIAGAVHTTTVDLFTQGDVKTPAKISWKLPKPFGCPVVVVDKLELDKSGVTKLEASSDKAYPGLKLECKSDFKSNFVPTNIRGGFTYSGLKDMLLKVESKPVFQDGAILELSHVVGPAIVAVKCDTAAPTAPDIALRFNQGPLFAALMVKEKFGNYQASAVYKANSDLKCAATYSYGGKTNGNFAVGLAFNAKGGNVIKVKAQQDQSLSLTLKHQAALGFTVHAGGKYNVKKGDFTYGLQVSIE